jgi:lathosterol oxidase
MVRAKLTGAGAERARSSDGDANMQRFVIADFSLQTMLVSFALLFVGGLCFYLITSGSSYLYYWVFRVNRYFPPEQRRKNEWGEVKKEWRWSLYNLLGNAVLTAPICALIVSGKSKVYFDVSEYGVAYTIFSAALQLAITELLVYWVHRLLHLPPLYRRLHIHHHRFRTPSPWTSMAFHPLDSFAQAAPHHLCVVLFPVYGGVYLFAIMFLQVWSTLIHERVSWLRTPLLHYTAHHSAHHQFFRCNYGQFFTICDRAFGTYKEPLGSVYDGALYSGRSGA